MKIPLVLSAALAFATTAFAQDGKYVPAGADMKAGVVDKLPKPKYPSALAAAKDKPQGTTMLRVFVNKTGALDSTKVTKSSGSADLDKAAVTFAQKSFKFSPYIVKGQPVAWFFDYLVDFKAPATAGAPGAPATPAAPPRKY